MAWMMGYIKYFDGRLKNGTLHVCWVAAKTGEPVDDNDVTSVGVLARTTSTSLPVNR